VREGEKKQGFVARAIIGSGVFTKLEYFKTLVPARMMI
jgi:hypothetical protein